MASIFVHAETTKTTDSNKTMTNDEFMKRFMALDKKEKDAVELGKKLDEINKLLGVDKKK